MKKSIYSNLIDESQLKTSIQSLNMKENAIKALICQRKVPSNGWPDSMIKAFLTELALMDSNNFERIYIFTKQVLRELVKEKAEFIPQLSATDTFISLMALEDLEI